MFVYTVIAMLQKKETGQNRCCNEKVQKVNFRGNEKLGQLSALLSWAAVFAVA